jgi:hypothetical protein
MTRCLEPPGLEALPYLGRAQPGRLFGVNAYEQGGANALLSPYNAECYAD